MRRPADATITQQGGELVAVIAASDSAAPDSQVWLSLLHRLSGSEEGTPAFSPDRRQGLAGSWRGRERRGSEGGLPPLAAGAEHTPDAPSGTEALASALELLYAAAAGAAGAAGAADWRPFLKHLSRSLGAALAALFVEAPPGPSADGPALVAAYLEPEDAGPEVQRLQEARFWVSREDWRLSGTTAPALRSGGPSALLTLMRPRGREPFGEEDLAFLRQLLPHVRRALDLQQRITATEARYEAAAGALDHLALGVLLLDEDGRLMGCNRAARERLAAREIRTGPGGLAASCPRETAALRSAVAKVVRAEPAEPAAREWVTTLSRPGSRPPLTAVAVPLRSGAALFVSNPDAGGVPEAVLRGLYGLSGAEARLTRLLLGGSRIEDAAAFLGVTLNTARTHLKRIFEKTGTDRQADLVRLLFGGPGALRLR